MEAESDLQIGLESISGGSGNAEPERSTSVNQQDDKELDRSLQQKIRKESELGMSDSASLKDDYSVLDHSVEARNVPSNDQPGLLEKENGQTIKSVVCPNHDKGCKWKGKVEDQAEHLNKFPNSEDEDEVEGCGFQTVECECKESVVFNQKSAHLREHLNHQEVACEFGYAGCDFRGPRYQMPKHLEANMPQHVSLLNEFTKRGKSKVESLETSRILYAHHWVFLFVVIILLVALVEYKSKVQELQSELERFCHDLEREEAHFSMSWAIHSSQLYDLRAKDGEHTRQLTVLQQLMNDLDRNLDELVSLQKNIQNKVTKKELQIKNLETEFNSHVRDIEREILRLQEFQNHVNKALSDLTFDVKDIKSGFSKKFIDDTIRTLKSMLMPKWLSSE